MTKRCYVPCVGHAREKTIADAANGLQKHRLGGIVFNVTAQADHEVVDGTRVGVLAHSPYLLQQLLAGDDASLVEHQVAEQIALHQGETDGLIRGRELERGEVDGAPGETETGRQAAARDG